MKRAPVFLRDTCVTDRAIVNRKGRERRAGVHGYVIGLVLLALTVCWASPQAFGQIQSTISCPAGHGYWDVLSVMMMDPGLATGYHMEGITGGLPSSYIYTMWDQSQNKLYYTKNPQGNPWDINLYDSNYVYQWITELQSWEGSNHWNDPRSCRKFNNGSGNSTSDFSMRWSARCASPGGANSTFWNPPPTTQPNNTNYYTYVDQDLQSPGQDLGYSFLKLATTEKMKITDHRATPAETFSITTLPLEYHYSCSVSGNINSCQSREIFDYGVDTDVNPVDKIKHSYGWVRWRLYENATGGNAKLPPVWVLSNISTSNHLMAGQVTPNFQCF